jgi:RNA polymerase sporulation-specific sigma factor
VENGRFCLNAEPLKGACFAMMISSLISFALGGLLFLALHVTGSGSFPRPLSAAEERDCLRKIAQGDAKARSYLIEHNLRLVAHIIKKYYSNIRDQDDLISIGTIGLIKAVGSFNAEKGARFSTYAARCIENEILMFFRSRKKYAQDLYIQDPIDTDGEGNALTLMDIVADDACIFEYVDLRIQSEKLHRLIAQCLDSREKQIVTLRYGLGGAMPMAQREVAARLGISRSYVSRLEKKALGKLRAAFCALEHPTA